MAKTAYNFAKKLIKSEYMVHHNTDGITVRRKSSSVKVYSPIKPSLYLLKISDNIALLYFQGRCVIINKKLEMRISDLILDGGRTTIRHLKPEIQKRVLKLTL